MSNNRTPEQTANLKRLAEVMETIADRAFEGLVGLESIEAVKDCGTYRCVLGWYLNITGKAVCFGLGQELNHFGIDITQSDALFGASGNFVGWKDQFSVCNPFDDEYDPEITRREVTARRDYLVNEILGGDAR